jgi:hypothetical protein
VTPTPGVPLPAAPPALTVPVSADLLRALLTMAILDARTGVLTFPAWRAQALAHLAASLDQDPAAVLGVLLVLDVDAFADLNLTWGIWPPTSCSPGSPRSYRTCRLGCSSAATAATSSS